MTKPTHFRYFKTRPEFIRLAVMLFVRFPLPLRNVEDLLHDCGIDVSHETVPFWLNRFGPMFASEIRRKRIDRMHAVDHEGEVLEAVVTMRRNRKAALKFLNKLMRRYGRPREIVTDRLPFYGAALKEFGAEGLQTSGRWLNNRVENLHLPLRRRGRAMLRFRRIRSLQTFAAVHSSVSNYFNQNRSLSSRKTFKLNGTAALEDWRQLYAA